MSSVLKEGDRGGGVRGLHFFAVIQLKQKTFTVVWQEENVLGFQMMGFPHNSYLFPYSY